MRGILTYHSIDSSGSPISVDECAFRRQIEWLMESGVAVVGLEEITTLAPDARAVALTFDDGFASFASLAWPVLREHALPVTLFIPTDHVGGSNAWDAGRGEIFPLLSWGQLAQLQAEGVTLGAHTRTHADLTRVSHQRLLDELEGASWRLLAETGCRARSFAYPFGRIDERVVAAVRPRYQMACTTEYRALEDREDMHRLPRLDAIYLRHPRNSVKWGSTAHRGRVWARARARNARQALTRMGVLR